MSKSEGARAPKRCVLLFYGQPCGARAGCLPCRGCGHIVSAPSIPPCASHVRVSGHSGSAICGPRDAERRCRRASAQSVAILPASSPRPRYLRRASPRDRRGKLPHRLNRATVPAPHQTLSCCVPRGKAGGVWGRFGGWGQLSAFDPKQTHDEALARRAMRFLKFPHPVGGPCVTRTFALIYSD